MPFKELNDSQQYPDVKPLSYKEHPLNSDQQMNINTKYSFFSDLSLFRLCSYDNKSSIMTWQFLFSEQLRGKWRFSCTHCKKFLIEPHQSNCGCRLCYECTKKCGNICPGCSKSVEKSSFIYDKAIEREILRQDVICLYERCGYKCKLKDMNEHIKSCKYNGGSEDEPAKYKCEDCEKILSKEDFRIHRDMLGNIDSLCDNMKSICPYKCTEEVQDNIKMHLGNCTRRIVECPMKYVGCLKMLPKVEMDDHVRDDVNYHMTLMMEELVKVNKENECIKENILQSKVKLSKEIKDLKNIATEKEIEIVNLNNKVSLYEKRCQILFQSNGPPQVNPQNSSSPLSSITSEGFFSWKIENIICKIQDAKRGINVSIFSDPFYTHIPGYKMCLKILPAGDGKRAENHMSLYFVIMEGDYDNDISWPYKKKISLSLQSNHTSIKNRTINMKPDANNSCYGKPTNVYNLAAGQPQFISHVELISTDEFIQNDAIIIHAKVF